MLKLPFMATLVTVCTCVIRPRIELKTVCSQPVDKGEDNICCAIWGGLGRDQKWGHQKNEVQHRPCLKHLKNIALNI